MPNGKAPVSKTGVRKDLQVQILSPPQRSYSSTDRTKVSGTLDRSSILLRSTSRSSVQAQLDIVYYSVIKYGHMIRNTAVISVSLPQEFLLILNQLTKKMAKTRSGVIKDLLLDYYQDQSWEQIFEWGRTTKEKFNIKSEEDIVKLIND